MKHRFINYLYFTRKERFGTLVLLALCIGIFCVPGLLSQFQEKPSTDFSNFEATIQAFKQAETAPSQAGSELFVFNPNEATADDLRKLGLSEKVARNIENYRNKGGQFRRPEDFKKIWGLLPADYERLAPFIRLGQAERTGDEVYQRTDRETADAETEPRPGSRFYPEFKSKKAPAGPVDLNGASILALTQLPMIGEKRAAQIIAFREKLGGFKSVEQLAEMYNFPDSVFQAIRPFLTTGQTPIQPLNLNTVSAAQLDAHPYISKKQADLIIAYREQHGPFGSPDDVLKIKAFSDKNWWEKVAPYLTAN